MRWYLVLNYPTCADIVAEMSMVQLIKQGHREIDEIDDTLARAERIAHDTLDIGTQVR